MPIPAGLTPVPLSSTILTKITQAMTDLASIDSHLSTRLASKTPAPADAAGEAILAQLLNQADTTLLTVQKVMGL